MTAPGKTAPGRAALQLTVNGQRHDLLDLAD